MFKVLLKRCWFQWWWRWDGLSIWKLWQWSWLAVLWWNNKSKPWHMLNLEYFRSFVHLEDFNPWGCSLKKNSMVTYSQLFTYFRYSQLLIFRLKLSFAWCFWTFISCVKTIYVGLNLNRPRYNIGYCFRDWTVLIDDYAKDGGSGEVWLLRSFYHEPLRTWIETNVNKFAISNHTALNLGKQALRSYLSLICEYELYILPDKKS